MSTTNNQLIKFVTDTIGEEKARLLNAIAQGGRNNAKGRDYENFFQLYKAFEIANYEDSDLNKHILSCQELAFIDDICHIDYKKSIKYNFQAKNSFTDAANWTIDISQRCEYQTKIDLEFYSIKKSCNYMIVPCKQKQQNNIDKIPAKLQQNNSCIFFPPYSCLVELIEQPEFKTYVGNLIQSKSTSDIDYAARLILGTLQASSSTPRSIQDIFCSAESEAHPNPFKKFRRLEYSSTIPTWINDLLEKTSNKEGYSIKCEYGRIILCINGLTVMSPLNLNDIEKSYQDKIENLKDLKDLVRLFLELTTSELSDFSLIEGA